MFNCRRGFSFYYGQKKAPLNVKGLLIRAGFNLSRFANDVA